MTQAGTGVFRRRAPVFVPADFLAVVRPVLVPFRDRRGLAGIG